jgi:hypothetical protein
MPDIAADAAAVRAMNFFARMRREECFWLAIRAISTTSDKSLQRGQGPQAGHRLWTAPTGVV